jgi:hypothetical protein
MAQLFCLAVPALIVLALLAIPARIGLRAWRAASHEQGERVYVLRFVALNMCEPIVNTVLVTGLLFAGGGLRDLQLQPALATLPMALLLIPALGLRFSDADLRQCSGRILLLGMGRWLANAFALQAMPWNMEVLIVVLPLISIGLLIYAAFWADGELNGLVLRPLRPLQPASSPPAIAYARPAPAPLQPERFIPPLDHSNASPCPHCQTLTWLEDAACASCGLLLNSRIPEPLRNLPRYDVLRPLGGGGMSSIYLVRDRAGGRLHVLKTLSSVDGAGDMQWRADAASCLRREATLLRELRHPGIVELTGWYSAPWGEYMVVEYVAGENLERARRTPSEVLRIGAGLADAIAYLSQQSTPVVHGDIKPANVVVSSEDGRVVLLDFGSALELDPPGAALPAGEPAEQGRRYGTPGFAAPEQYNGSGDLRTDVYGLAATLYVLLTNDDPSLHPLAFPQLAALPAPLSELLARALDRDPTLRPAPAEFAALLREVGATLGEADWPAATTLAHAAAYGEAQIR